MPSTCISYSGSHLFTLLAEQCHLLDTRRASRSPPAAAPDREIIPAAKAPSAYSTSRRWANRSDRIPTPTECWLKLAVDHPGGVFTWLHIRATDMLRAAFRSLLIPSSATAWRMEFTVPARPYSAEFTNFRMFPASTVSFSMRSAILANEHPRLPGWRSDDSGSAKTAEVAPKRSAIAREPWASRPSEYWRKLSPLDYRHVRHEKLQCPPRSACTMEPMDSAPPSRSTISAKSMEIRRLWTGWTWKCRAAASLAF